MSELIDGVVDWPIEDAERFRSTGLWRGTGIFDAIEDTARRHLDDIALVDGDQRLTYRELMARGEAGAARLLGIGLRPGDRVVVQLPNGWQFVGLLLACLRSGVVPVMALPSHRRLELTAIASVAEARAIAIADRIGDFDHRDLADEIATDSGTIAHVLVTGEPRAGHIDLDALLQSGDVCTAPSPVSSEVALFLLSGGTTGMPKLISRTHDDYVCNALACNVVSEITERSVYLVTLPAGHNFPLACPGVLGTLLAGGRIVMLPSAEPFRAMDAIAREGVTIAAAVPAVAQRWIAHAEACGAESIRSLRVLQVGGSRMPDEIAARVAPALGCTLQQVFGMAEGLINMTRLDDPIEVITSTQGRPVCEHDEVRIVDADGSDVPDGTRGSILTRGPYTPRGYFRASEANERSFLDGWYSSGDIVERRADGNLVVHGRDKDLINRGGEKISAEEVESLAYRIDAIDLAAAVAISDPVLSERVCLIAVLQPGTSTDLDEIRGVMRSAGIAAFKLPERFEIVEAMPMTKIGKIDKRALRELLDPPPQPTRGDDDGPHRPKPADAHS